MTDQSEIEEDVLFDTTEEVSPEAPKEAPKAEAAEPKPEPKRDQSGKFVAKEETGEEKQAEPPAAERQPEKSHNVPITALLDEREKRQRLESEISELRRQVQASQPKPEPIDPITDPEGYARTLQSGFQREIVSTKLAQSRFFAEREYGADEVREAFEYFNDHPQQSHALLNEPSPFHAAVEYVRKQKAMQEIGDDPAAFRTRITEELKAQLREELLAEMRQQQPEERPRTPPRTLASAAGGVTAPPPSSGNALFDD